VTCNSLDRGGVFQVHTAKGIVKFKPTPKGLHALNLKKNPKAAFILVDDMGLAFNASPSHQMHVATVRNNFEGFTKRQIE
jgi:hypothetical protein